MPPLKKLTYDVTITEEVHAGVPQLILLGYTFVKDPSEKDSNTHALVLTEEEADGLRADGYEVSESKPEEVETKPPDPTPAMKSVLPLPDIQGPTGGGVA